MKEDYLQYVQNRLYHWAEWFITDRHGLDYPSCSIEYLLMAGEARGVKKSPGYINTDAEAEEIENLVREMFEYNSNMAIAIRIYYFTNGGMRVKSKIMKISHVTFKNYVDMAHQWLAGRLSTYYKKL